MTPDLTTVMAKLDEITARLDTLQGPQDKTLNKHEAARHLSISERQLQRLVDARKVKCHRLGPKTIRYKRSELDAYLRETLVASAADINRLTDGRRRENRVEAGR